MLELVYIANFCREPGIDEWPLGVCDAVKPGPVGFKAIELVRLFLIDVVES